MPPKAFLKSGTSSGPVLIDSVQAPVVFKSRITLRLLKLHVEMADSIMSNNEINVSKEVTIECAREIKLNRYTMYIEKLGASTCPKPGKKDTIHVAQRQ